MPRVDVVVVSYNSREHLRGCVEPLADCDDLHVIVIDNHSSDSSLETIAGLEVERVALERNGGFAAGCNAGWRRGSAASVLFLNPDARIDPSSVDRLLQVLEHEPTVGAAAPRILEDDGSIDFSQRQFPRLRSTYAQALFLHRLFPRARWTDEVIRDDGAYARRGSAEWVSGACLLVRRAALEELNGWDEEFFMYCEDTDLCRRLRDAGYDVRFEPAATAVHAGGASAPRASLLPTLAASRLRYASKHSSRGAALVERLGVALGALTHMVVSGGGRAARAGHARSLRLAASRSVSRT